MKICKTCSLYSMKLNDLLSKQNKPSKVEKYLNLLYISVQNTMVKENSEEMASFYLTASNKHNNKSMKSFRTRLDQEGDRRSGRVDKIIGSVSSLSQIR